MVDIVIGCLPLLKIIVKIVTPKCNFLNLITERITVRSEDLVTLLDNTFFLRKLISRYEIILFGGVRFFWPQFCRIPGFGSQEDIFVIINLI